MKVCVSGVRVKDGKIFLCMKDGLWFLPGGKRKKGETEQQCFLREMQEEFPGLIVEVTGGIYSEEWHIEKSRHGHEKIAIHVYFFTAEGDEAPSGEVEDAMWADMERSEDINISTPTRKIMEFLREKGFHLNEKGEPCFAKENFHEKIDRVFADRDRKRLGETSIIWASTPEGRRISFSVICRSRWAWSGKSYTNSCEKCSMCVDRSEVSEVSDKLVRIGEKEIDVSGGAVGICLYGVPKLLYPGKDRKCAL